jgi:hypothetical protein
LQQTFSTAAARPPSSFNVQHGALLPLSPRVQLLLPLLAVAPGGHAQSSCCSHAAAGGSSDARFISVVEAMAKQQLMPNKVFYVTSSFAEETAATRHLARQEMYERRHVTSWCASGWWGVN